MLGDTIIGTWISGTKLISFYRSFRININLVAEIRHYPKKILPDYHTVLSVKKYRRGEDPPK
jgi:hypothetical protein